MHNIYTILCTIFTQFYTEYIHKSIHNIYTILYTIYTQSYTQYIHNPIHNTYTILCTIPYTINICIFFVSLDRYG